MATALAAIGKALTAIATALKKAAEWGRKANQIKEIWNKGKTWIVSILIIAILIPAAAVGALMGAARDFVNMCESGFLDILGLGEQDLYDSASDARDFYNKLRLFCMLGLIEDGAESSDKQKELVKNLNNSHLYMDTDTLLLIVGEVADYNDRLSGSNNGVSVYTEYRLEKTKDEIWPHQISPLSGNLILPEVRAGNNGYYNTSGIISKGQGLVTKPSGKDYSHLEDLINKGNSNANRGPGSPYIGDNKGSGSTSGWGSSFPNASGDTSSGFVPGQGLIPSKTPPPNGYVTPTATPAPTVAPTAVPTAVPTPTPTPEPRYEVEYIPVGQDIDDLIPTGMVRVRVSDIEKSVSDGGWDRGPTGEYERMDYMRWQPVAALCCYYISVTREDWGTYTEPGDTYYISKAKVQELMDLFAFRYEYVQEVYGNNSDSRYMFENYLVGNEVSVPFKTDIKIYPEKGLSRWKKYRETRRTPAYAPYRISNSYISYLYGYETEAEQTVDGGNVEYAYAKSVTYNVQPGRLLDAMEEKIPFFSDDLYVHMLKMFPKSEESVDYFKNVIMAPDRDELKSWTTTVTSTSPSLGVIAGLREYGNRGSGGFDMNGDMSGLPMVEGSYVVPLYAADGTVGSMELHIAPHPDIVNPGEDYGRYVIHDDAHAPLDVSDNLSLSQLTTLVNSDAFLKCFRYTTSPLLCDESVRNELAECLYAYQERTGSSVTGVLGLLAQEGGFTSSYAKSGYNYFHIKVGSSSEYVGIGESAFRNYKQALESGSVTVDKYRHDAVKAFSLQVDWVYRNYWNRSSGKQNSFYRMIFNNYAGDGTRGLSAYQKISHSYCPPWDDPAMPYSRNSYIINAKGGRVEFWKSSSGATHFGWANNCARYRAKFYGLATSGG